MIAVRIVVRGMDMFGETTDFYVNTTGAYDGKRLYFQLDADDFPPRQFSIETEGGWEFTIYPFAEGYVPLVNVPGEYTGTGDDVIVLQPPGTKLTANAAGEGQFIIWARSLVFDELAPFTGTIDLPYQTVILEILTDSSFTLEISD